MYSNYICEFSKNVALLEEHCRKNPAFAKVVKEFEVIEPLRLVFNSYLKCLCSDVNSLSGGFVFVFLTSIIIHFKYP